ncbi:IS3 family transposase [Streptomyces virginiae]|uniref:IS3 family transposase n=1 Tax=Streptomyces virginiae TaxID=1961 RepID=UPI00099C2646
MRKARQNSDGTYRAPGTTVELHDEDGPAVNHKRVAWIMWTIGLEGVRLRRRRRTTLADRATPKTPNLICRDFTATEVNTKYVRGITYLPVTARSRSTRRPPPTSPHAARPAGSPTTCGQSSSPTRSPPPSGPAGAWPARSHTPTTPRNLDSTGRRNTSFLEG